jgi:uncharacterized protein YggU (UPF0235/DUF167 family)
MILKYYTEPNKSKEYFVFTGSQLRDYEIKVSYMVLVRNGHASSSVISMLASAYSVSKKTIERTVYS